MRANPAEYKALDPPNGWGSYESALPWLEKVLEAFRANPNGIIRVSKWTGASWLDAYFWSYIAAFAVLDLAAWRLSYRARWS